MSRRSYVVRYVERVNEIHVDEHSRRGTQSAVVGQREVVELEVSQRQLLRVGNRQLLSKQQFTTRMQWLK